MYVAGVKKGWLTTGMAQLPSHPVEAQSRSLKFLGDHNEGLNEWSKCGQKILLIELVVLIFGCGKEAGSKRASLN